MRLEQGTCRLSGMTALYAGATDPGRVRRGNEDDLLLLPEAGIFAVADGLGGLDAGDVASRTALAQLRHLCLSGASGEGKQAADRLGALLATVNRRTYEYRLSLGNSMATTLALVQFGLGTVLAAHVGDSRIYRWHDHELTSMTSDHSLVNELCQQGALTASQARLSPQRHVITRAIGAEPTVVSSIKPMIVTPGDWLLLCTDGLTSMLTDEAIATCLRTGPADIGQMVAHLILQANVAGGHDNVTVILIALQQEDGPELDSTSRP